MTGGFQSLYYTDCLPGQGLRGGAGFQFQAVSPGVTHEEMTLVQRSALYEPPVSWMRDQRPVSDYPPSLAHVFDGFYVTARGIYLGAEANGVREGNQFTHAVSTSTVDSYGLVRPAQLWDASWWSEKPAASTECEPIEAEPEPGPWSVDAIRDWVLGRPDAEEWLIALRSALDNVHGEKRRRVLFVSDDPTAVLGWIAAGTLLLPQARALQVGFRVFTTNPQRSEHDVLAVHPDWAGQFTNVDRVTDFVVFNLVTSRHSPVEPTDAAQYWVPQFLRDDPFDVVDAIELAHQFTQGRSDTTDVPADRLASSVIVGGRQLADPAEAQHLAVWLADQTRLSTDDTLEPLADAILAAGAGVEALRALDAVVLRMDRTSELAARTGMALLTAELAAIQRGEASVPDTPLPAPHPWPQADRDNAVKLVEQAADSVAPARMDLVLRTATRFGLRPVIGRFATGAHRFVQWWVDHPTPPLDPARWPDGQLLVDQVKDELRHRHAGQGQQFVGQAIRDHWWPLLHRTVSDLSDPVDLLTSAAAVDQGGTKLRQEIVSRTMAVVSAAKSSPQLARAWNAMFLFARPTMAELAEFVRVAPVMAISREFGETAFGLLDDACQTNVTTRDLDVLRGVVALAGGPKSYRLQQLYKQDSDFATWLGAVRSRTLGTDYSPRTVTATVINARGSQLIDVLLTEVPLAVACQGAAQGGRDVHVLLEQNLPRYWNASDVGDTAVALAFATGISEACATEITGRIEKQIGKWLRHAPGERVHAVRKLLATVDKTYVAQWDMARGHKPEPAPKAPAKPKPAARPPAGEPAGEDAGRKRAWQVWRKDKAGD